MALLDRSSLQTVLLLTGPLLLVLIKTSSDKWRTNRKGLPYPPGPKPKLITGNTGDMPTSTPWITYMNWSKLYSSDIIYARDYGDHVVILNSLEDAIELFEKRSRIYSDRPITTLIELMGWDFNVGLMPYGDNWRRHRRIFQQNFRREASIGYQPTQLKKVQDLLRNLLLNPEDFAMHYRRAAAAIVMSTIYGHELSPTDDHFVNIAEQSVAKLSESIFPGAAIVNAFPILRHLPAWFPGAWFQRMAADCRKLTDDMQNLPFNFVKKNMADGTGVPSLCSKLLWKINARGQGEEEEEAVKRVTATSYAAGADTTVSALGTIFYALATNPEVQKKAQEEIDTVIGSHRLPDYDDRLSLPYIEAVYREIMRWKPVTPLGVAHSTTEDDVYKGYFIPKGTSVMPNIWAMTRDESIYPEPEMFRPERYLDKDGQLNDNDTVLSFGFGRRICVGRHMASATIWLTIASVLSSFNVTRAKDESGQEIPIEGDYSDGLIVHPHPFQCSIVPRSDQARRLIMEATSAHD